MGAPIRSAVVPSQFGSSSFLAMVMALIAVGQPA